MCHNSPSRSGFLKQSDTHLPSVACQFVITCSCSRSCCCHYLCVCVLSAWLTCCAPGGSPACSSRRRSRGGRMFHSWHWERRIRRSMNVLMQVAPDVGPLVASLVDCGKAVRSQCPLPTNTRGLPNIFSHDPGEKRPRGSVCVPDLGAGRGHLGVGHAMQQVRTRPSAAWR
jgi:hypothetical protein